MKKKLTQAMVGLTGAAMLLNGCAAPAQIPAEQPVSQPAAQRENAPAQEESRIEITQTAPVEYEKVANVQGEFSFDQNMVTPADEVFNLFGTVATGMCAKPGFAFDAADTEKYYVNIGGDIQREYHVTLDTLVESEDSVSRMMKCSCATGGAIANAEVTGVKVADILQFDEISEEINTITFKSEDGYGIPMPLSYALENDAMLVYKINGKDLPAQAGGPLQVWMPTAVAKYFTRQVVEIELTAQEEVPAVVQAEDKYRAKVSILNNAEEDFHVGDRITFEGYADDFDVPVAAVEFSMDGGETWTSCATEGADAYRWVYWNFAYVPETAGTYKLEVRARTQDGRVSPLAAGMIFTVEDATL